MTQPLGGNGTGDNGFLPSGEEDAFAFLADLQANEGVDILSLLTDAEEGGPTQTREGEVAPGEGPSPGLELDEDQLKELAHELCDLVDRYQQAAEPQAEQEQEIRDAWSMSNASSTGPGLGSNNETLVSEAMMVQVDQVSARLTTNLTSVKPTIKVDPVLGTSYDDPELTKLADSTQSFLCEYVLNEMDYRHILPQAIHRCVKVGTAVARLEWAEEEQTRTFYPREASKQTTETIKVGSVRGPLIENRLMIVWPPTILNWQRDYEVVGHESWHSRSSWKRLAASWDLKDEVRAEIEANPGERDERADKENLRAGVDSTHMDGNKLVDPQIKLTELWCYLWLPAPYKRRVKFQVILHRPTQHIVWADINRHFTQKHPYFPIRYKWSDLSAWGTGVGHEALNCWAADTALWNLSLENIAAGAFNIVIRDAGSVHNTIARPVRPGMEVVSSNPEKDYIVRSMGGDAAEIPATRQENQMRMKMATGVPDVAMGMGDPTMKSGAGTGSTLALIEQAGMKIRMVDQTMREDLSDLFGFILELVAQYGDDGVFYNHVSEADASRMERLRYYPPRGRDVSSMFRIRAMAPSAATSTEARRNNMLVIWGFAQQAVMTMNQVVSPLLQAQNPAGLARWQRSMADVLHEIMRRVLELHEVPGVLGLMMPELPEATPEDQQINALNQQLQQANGMIQQLQAQAQQLMGGGQQGQTGAPPVQSQAEEAQEQPPPPPQPSTPMPSPAMSMGGMQ